MKKNLLNNELGRIKSLMGTDKVNPKLEINEDILSLYKKFDIILNEKTIEVLSNGMLNEQGIGEKISNASKNIGVKFRNAFQNRWSKNRVYLHQNNLWKTTKKNHQQLLITQHIKIRLL